MILLKAKFQILPHRYKDFFHHKSVAATMICLKIDQIIFSDHFDKSKTLV